MSGQGWTTVARWVSILAHPFATATVMAVTAGLRSSSKGGASSALVLAAVGIVPVAVLIAMKVRAGHWENVDASNPRERPILFAVAGLTMAVVLAGLLLRDPRSFLVRGVAATLGLVIAAAAVTPWIKASLHMAFATMAATVLALMGSPVGLVLILVLPVLAWSRLRLARHRPLEVVVGTLLGAIAGGAIRFA